MATIRFEGRREGRTRKGRNEKKRRRRRSRRKKKKQKKKKKRKKRRKENTHCMRILTRSTPQCS